jgi:hypothetical protein
VRRRAAGRADGRPCSTRDRSAAGGARRLGAAVATALLAVLAVVVGPPAAAAPAGDDAAPPDDHPVHLTVARMEPRTVTPGSTIVLSGTLVNDSEDTFTDLAVRLQRGALLPGRRALAAERADPSDANVATGSFQPVAGELDPGKSLAFSYTATPAELQLTDDGVYPALVNVNGTRSGGAAERVGELSTYLVVQPAAPADRTAVAWLWPFTDRPHRNAGGAFTDDALAGELAPGGRLFRALAVLEQLPPAPGSATPPPVTLAVDPPLLEEVAAMAAGRYTVGDRVGGGTEDAADFLTRLRRVAAAHPVAALPYADVDADALVSAGLDAALTRTLPGTPEGTAHQPVGDDGTAAGATGADRGGAEGDTGAGAAIVRAVLGVAPRTDLAWPVGDTVDPGTLDVLAGGGASTVVLPETALTGGDRAVGAVPGTVAAARSDLSTSTGTATALVTDDALTAVVAAAGTEPGGPRIAEQRYLAELAVLTGRPDDAQPDDAQPAAARTVLVAPPRQVDADPVWASAMIGDTVTQPWLAAASVTDLADGPVSEAGRLARPDRPGGGLGREGMAVIAGSVGVRNDFAAAVPGDPATALAGYDAAIARAGSAAWRDDPAGFTAAAEDLRRTVTALRDRVRLLDPADGTYSLASSDAPLVLTVRNDLPFAVDVRLQLSARGNVGFSADDVGVTTLQPESRTTMRVPAHVRQSGSFTVTAALTTPTGGPLGEPVQMQVKSTAYGTVTVLITLGAAALLGLLFLRRLVRFLLARRRGAPPAEDPAALGPQGVPPVRSPV